MQQLFSHIVSFLKTCDFIAMEREHLQVHPPLGYRPHFGTAPARHNHTTEIWILVRQDILCKHIVFWHRVLGFNIATAITFCKLSTAFFSAPQAHLGWRPTCYGPQLSQLQEVYPSTIPYRSQESCLLAPASVCCPPPWQAATLNISNQLGQALPLRRLGSERSWRNAQSLLLLPRAPGSWVGWCIWQAWLTAVEVSNDCSKVLQILWYFPHLIHYLRLKENRMPASIRIHLGRSFKISTQTHDLPILALVLKL